MKVEIESRSGRSLAQIITLSPDSSVKDLKNEFANNTNNKDTSRHRFTIMGKPLDDDRKSLNEYGFRDLDGSYKVVFKDLGPQIGWQNVFVIEYAGPLILYFFFYMRPSFVYGIDPPDQYGVERVLACMCFCGHFVKREFETLYVHRFSAETMPIFNLWKNCAYYWISALVLGFILNHPTFVFPHLEYAICGLAIFLISELFNGICHLQLRNLRRPGTRDRAIPTGLLFEFVSCPNYTCEITAWIGFTVMTMSWASALFTVVGFAQMLVWAQKKHYRYKKEFPNYPKSRKMLIPFIY